MKAHILVVDDDSLIRHSLTFTLEQAGYAVQSAGSAEEALTLAQQAAPDLMLLDIGLPGMSGLDALRQFRTTFTLPIIFLTARRRELDEVVALESGGDDYITKPFDTNVLLAHIRAVLRRSPPIQSAPQQVVPDLVIVGDLVIDAAAHTVHVHGQACDLTPREFDLLMTLARNAGRICSVEELLTAVWGEGYEGESQIVYVHMRWLREKLEADPSHPQRLITVRGVGYKLIPQEDAHANTA